VRRERKIAWAAWRGEVYWLAAALRWCGVMTYAGLYFVGLRWAGMVAERPEGREP
jgi:hypothetical protein